MAHHLLPYAPEKDSDSLSLHDRVQIALAIADEVALKSLLLDCTPPIAQPHHLGNIGTTIGVPMESRKAVDGVIQFEEIRCVLADSPELLEQDVTEYRRRNGNRRGYLDLTRCEAEMRVLGQALSLSQALALLTHSGFSHRQIEDILHLPQDGWFKSWWYTLDPKGDFTVPFLRLMRTLHFNDGTVTIQYKDFFATEKPACYMSQVQKVLIEIGTEPRHFSKTLERINYARQKLQIERAILICDRLSDLEARGYISQGISLYTARETILPAQASCANCMTACPLRGNGASPVRACQNFCLDGSI